MEIIETPTFSRKIVEFLTDDEYRLLQSTLLIRPDIGDLIPGGRGIRKLRWVSEGKGKRGGLRIIYYWYTDDDKILMLLPYKKTRKEDLTAQELKVLAGYVEEFLL